MESMSKFWKRAVLTGVILTGIIWLTLIIESVTDPFLQECYQLGEGAYCAKYEYTSFGKAVVIGAIMVPLLTIGVLIIGKIKYLEAQDKAEEAKKQKK